MPFYDKTATKETNNRTKSILTFTNETSCALMIGWFNRKKHLSQIYSSPFRCVY